jgi:hypothetical protein
MLNNMLFTSSFSHGTSVIVPLILGQMQDESLVVGLVILEKRTLVGCN